MVKNINDAARMHRKKRRLTLWIKSAKIAVMRPPLQNNFCQYCGGTEFVMADGTTYINEWANLKFVLPEGFADADASVYAQSETATVDCGGYFMSQSTGEFIYFSFEKLPIFSSYTAEEYLDSSKNFLQSTPELTFTYEDTYGQKVIAGQTFSTLKLTKANAGVAFESYLCVRIEGNYAVCVSATSIFEGNATNLLDMVTTAH